MPHELIVEVTRNGNVESQHTGSAAVCDFAGNVVHSWGDTDALMFPRSALKPMLAIQVVESGASEHFSLDDKELSLACASHQGEAIHEKKVAGWLQRLGLNQNHLACGPALPDDEASAQRVLASGQVGCRLHHNCSGKHAAFLTTALHMDMPLETYHRVDHPLQVLSLDILSDLAGVDIRHNPMGVDGCGFPAPTMPLVALARAAARFAHPVNLSSQRVKAIYRLHAAVKNQPLYAAGHGTVVSDLNEITKGAVLAKTGAEGVLIAALPAQGLGIALKITDGNARARPVALLAILDHMGALSDDEKRRLQGHANPRITNSRSEITGDIRPAESWLAA